MLHEGCISPNQCFNTLPDRRCTRSFGRLSVRRRNALAFVSASIIPFASSAVSNCWSLQPWVISRMRPWFTVILELFLVNRNSKKPETCLLLLWGSAPVPTTRSKDTLHGWPCFKPFIIANYSQQGHSAWLAMFQAPHHYQVLLLTSRLLAARALCMAGYVSSPRSPPSYFDLLSRA